MKRLLILMLVGIVLLGASGCKFWECLWHGPPQPCQQPVTCAPPCATLGPASCCDGCVSGCPGGCPGTTAPAVVPAMGPSGPGPEPYPPH
jgi:hypothetical protein